VFTAAVADFSPVPVGDSKYKKQGGEEAASMQRDGYPLTVPFNRTTDILRTLGNAKRADQRIIGFAAETENVHERMKRKLKVKNTDMLVGNNIKTSGAGFGTSTNEVSVVDRNGRLEDWPMAPKPEVAWRVLDWLLQL